MRRSFDLKALGITHQLKTRLHSPWIAAMAFFLFAGTVAFSQQVNPNLFNGMRWRLIGPFRGGRASAVTGVPSQPGVYYFGAAQGGVWKTNDGGQVWRPIFDQEHVASIGAIAVAASNPNVVYVGTGESTPGNGVYKSTDAGATWTNVGLRDTRFISGILVDPRNPDIVLVAAGGDRIPGSARGIYKSTDGGKTWNKALFRDESSGAVDLCAAPDDPQIVYASLARRTFGPQAGNASSPESAIYASSDEGSTWNILAMQGLPTRNLGRIGISVAPGTQGRRVYAIMNQGLFRSDDAGATWRPSTSDPRIPTFGKVLVDPRNANVVYVPQTSLYRSTDGGQTFESFMGAPSGDDIRLIWVNPLDSRQIILGVDQGAVISMNGGETWSSWYNQPTGQFYHVSTDNDFPYRVYAAQQDSGTAAVASRSDYGEITERDWAPIGGFEFGFIAADPTDPNIVYSGGWYGTVIRFDRRTGQYAHVFVRTSKYRTAGLAPLIFSPQDPHTLYFGTQFVLKTTDGGMSWQAMSPDLTQGQEASQTGGGRGRMGGAITTLAPSQAQAGVIWAGTSNGLVQVTRDAGAKWENVSAGLPSPASITLMDASPQDAATAHVALSTGQDGKPYIYRTHDFGKTWQKIVEGLDESAIARVVREDPVRKGLLYAGTEKGVYVSFDDGDHWQSLQLELPTTSVRDLDVHGDDLVAATYGRSLWILDDVTPLRQADARVADAPAHLFGPATAVRVRWDQNQDTPLPPETPAGQNPPDGAILDYYLKSAPAREVTLEIFDSWGKLLRHYSSVPSPTPTALPNVPDYWFAPPDTLPNTPGMHRLVWDLRYPHPLALPYNYYGNLINYTEYTLADHAIPGQTPRVQPVGPLALPGDYKIVLAVDGKSYPQTLTVRLDPRLHTSQADLAQQQDLEMKIGAGMAATYNGFYQLRDLRAALTDRRKALAANPQAGDAASALQALEEKLAAVADGTRTEPGLGPENRDLARLATMVQSADIRPSETAREATAETCQALNKSLALWRQINAQELPALSALLQKYGAAPLPPPGTTPADMPCGN